MFCGAVNINVDMNREHAIAQEDAELHQYTIDEIKRAEAKQVLTDQPLFSMLLSACIFSHRFR